MIPPHSAVADNAFLLITWCTTSSPALSMELRKMEQSFAILMPRRWHCSSNTPQRSGKPCIACVHSLLRWRSILFFKTISFTAQWGIYLPSVPQKNAYHNDKCLISEPASSSLWPAVRKNTLSKISYQKRPKNVAKGERFDK